MRGGETLFGFVLLSLTGCVNPFAPKLTQSLDNGELIITGQKTPEEVLQNFKVAYTFRDSLLYSNCLDTGFVFGYYDYNTTLSVSWTRNEDLRTTGRLFRHFNVIHLVWESSYDESVDDEAGRAAISKQYRLSLTGREVNYSLSGKAFFSFIRCMDGKWRIQKWEDVSDY